MTSRIAMYWHNGRSLGHTSRSAAIGEAILRQVPESTVIGITGASKGMDLLPNGMDYLKIPSYLAYDDAGGVRTTPVISITKKEFQYIRQNLIASFVRDFRPHAFVVDYHPQGKNGELVPSLLNSPETKKVLGLRGVLNTPSETNAEFFNQEMVDFVMGHFSCILVYVDPSVFCLEEYYRIPKNLREMIRYTGYVARPSTVTKEEARAALNIPIDARMILVNFGGGQGTEELWKAVLDAISKIRHSFDLAYLATGPYLNGIFFDEMRSSLTQRSNWVLAQLFRPMEMWIKASDLFISSGGYNSLAEIMANSANSLVIPRQMKEMEQKIHTERLVKMKLVRTLDPVDLTSQDLASMIQTCLSEPYPSRPITVDTGGANRSAQLIQEVIA